MKWNKGNPRESGSYLAVMKTEAGNQVEILNFGVTDAFPIKDWYLAGEDGPVVFENVIAWSDLPEYDEEKET